MTQSDISENWGEAASWARQRGLLYHSFPSHIQTCLLGLTWDKCYFDRCLPMGCSTSCQIFESFSYVQHQVEETELGIPHIVHDLEDFLSLNYSHAVCDNKLECFITPCDDTGVPLAPEKTFKPSTVMIFLGYELDTS